MGRTQRVTSVSGIVLAAIMATSAAAQGVVIESNGQNSGVIIEGGSGSPQMSAPEPSAPPPVRAPARPAPPTTRPVPAPVAPSPIAVKPSAPAKALPPAPPPVAAKASPSPAQTAPRVPEPAAVAPQKSAPAPVVVDAPKAAPAPPPPPTAARPARKDSGRVNKSAEPSDKVFRVSVITLPHDGTKALSITGDFMTGSFTKVKRILDENPEAKTLVLTSGGGIVLEGALIGRFAQTRGLNTRVDSVCASACTLVLAGGADRVISPGARIGFHKSYRVGGPNPFETAGDVTTGDTMLRQSLERAGVAGDFVTKALTTPSETMWYPTEAEMLTARLLTRSGATLGLAEPKAESGTRTDIRAKMLEKPIWASALAANREQFEQAVDYAWLSRAMGTNETDSIARAKTNIYNRLSSNFEALPDSVIAEMIATERENITKALADKRTYCEAFSSGSARGEEGEQKRDAMLLKLLAAKPESHPMTEKQATEAISSFTVLAMADGKIKMEQGRTRIGGDRCSEQQEFLDAIASLPVAEQANLMRAMQVSRKARIEQLAKLLKSL